MTDNIEIQKSTVTGQDKKRRRREVIIILSIIIIVTLLTFAENRIIRFGADIPVSNTILMFILININLLLLTLLIFLVLRNLVKLLYDRKRKVMGSKLRTKLVVAFITLTLLPTIVLFFFSINFITASIKFWFNVPVEQALEKSLLVGRSIYKQVENNNRFFLERAAYQIIKKKLLAKKNKKALGDYIKIVQREFNIDSVEVYDKNSKRLTMSHSSQLRKKHIVKMPADNFLQERTTSEVWSISEYISRGELIRTIGTIPFGATKEETKGFLVLARLISPDLAQNMKSISIGFDSYQKIKLLKMPVQVTFYIFLSIVSLIVLFSAIWFGFYMAKSISIPIQELAEGTRRIAEGELGFTIKQVADDEMGSLVNSFNKMTRDLHSSREQLERSALILQKQNIEIEERRRYMEIVLKNVSTGVITMNADGFVTTINTSAEKMLNLKSGNILNKNYKNLLLGKYLILAEEVIEKLTDTKNDTVELPIRVTIEDRPRSFLANINALKDDSGNPLGTIMVFDDLTELEKAQRIAAWREVARRIAHEVKNPLTPITLSAQRLKRKYKNQLDDPVFEECTQMIIDHVDLIRNLVNEFSVFAKFPTANPKPSELPPIIEDTIALYKEGHQKIVFETRVSDDFPILNLDRRQIKQAMINLIDNAIAAIKAEGKITITLSFDSILKLARIEVSDNGLGVSDEDKTRLFEPNFSTKTAGTGLGLTIVNTIIADHNGMISVHDHLPHGAKFVIELPV